LSGHQAAKSCGFGVHEPVPRRAYELVPRRGCQAASRRAYEAGDCWPMRLWAVRLLAYEAVAVDFFKTCRVDLFQPLRCYFEL
jgi:hypothetical protein